MLVRELSDKVFFHFLNILVLSFFQYDNSNSRNMLVGGPQINMDYQTVHVRCSDDVLEFIFQYRMAQVKAIEKKLRVYNGEIDIDDKILVTARSDGINWAVQMVNELIDKVVCDSFEIVQPGIKTFCAKGRLDSLLRMVQTEEKCHVGVDMKFREEPNSSGSNGSAAAGTVSPSPSNNANGSSRVIGNAESSADSSVVFVTPQGHKISWKIGDIAKEQVCC